MPGELRVDTAPLASGGQGLLGAAGDIPLPPVPFTAAGADALSTILNARTRAIEAPLIAGMPVTKAEALRTAQNIIQAARMYEGADQQLADQVLKALAEMEGAESAGGTGGAGGSAAGSAATPAAGAAEQAGQMGQMMGMPMQMAQQAAQIPMQLAGMAASIPQGIMQGVQSAMQQVSQMAGGAGEKTDPELDQQGDGSRDEADRAEEVLAEKARPSTPSDGAEGPSNAERAPAPAPQPAPDVPQQPHKPAPTRPATSGPESVL
jgi:ESX secretion-associated protein EspJ